MKILIVLPKGQPHRLIFGPIKMSFREAPLTATMLAALVPAELNAEIAIVDESVSTIPFHENFDLAGISILTGTAARGYAVADAFRKKGTKVVIGGVHATLMPDEAAEHADAVVTGFAERTWPRLLRDFAQGRLEARYSDENVPIDNLPAPRRDLQKRFGYMVPNTVFATRGCRSNCEFCSVPAASFGWTKRPIGDVIDDIRRIKARRIAFNDVNLTDDPDYAKELLAAMIPLKKKWGGLASVRIARDEELLDLLKKSGCRYLLFGFESIDESALRGINKRFNKADEYALLMRELHARNIVVQGCFIFGMDGESPDVFARTVECVNQLKIDIPRYAVFTPYPGTAAFRRLKAAGRILHENWELYDTQHVVFAPDRMSPQELYAGFKWSFEKTFALKESLVRARAAGPNFFVALAGNLAYRIHARRL